MSNWNKTIQSVNEKAFLKAVDAAPDLPCEVGLPSPPMIDLERLERLAEALRKTSRGFYEQASRDWDEQEQVIPILKMFGTEASEAAEAIPALIAAVRDRDREVERLRGALRQCQTSIAGYAITDPKQYPDVIADFLKEIRRVDGIARSALGGQP